MTQPTPAPAVPTPTPAPAPDTAPNPAPTPSPAPSPAPAAPTPTPTPAAPTPKTGEPEPTPAPTPKPADAATFTIPDEFKDKPWASKVKSQDDLWKQLANTQELIGKKTVIPDLTKATPEEKEAFYAQLRPKSGEEYTFTPDVPIDPDMKTGVVDLLMKNGVSAVQGNEIIKGYQTIEAAKVAEMFHPDGFKKTMETAFGAEWEKVTGHTRNTIKGMMNADDQKMMDALPNPYLALIYRTLGNVVKAYGIKETDSAHLGPGGGPAPTDVAGQRQAIRDQIGSLQGRPHTEQEVMALRTKLADTYKNDPRLQNAG